MCADMPQGGKVRGIAAHCMRLCSRNGETTAGFTELTINCNNNNMYWYVCITLKQTYKTQINGFKFSNISKV